MGTAERIKSVVKIIHHERERDAKIIVVCSAMGGVTDTLIEMCRLAQAGDASYREVFATIRDRYFTCASELFSARTIPSVQEYLESSFQSLSEILRGIFLIQECTVRSRDLVMSVGERLSTFLVCEAFRTLSPETSMLDTRSVVKTNDQFGNARVNMEETCENIRHHVNSHTSVYVVTGFIGSTDKGETTTLGRGGSDYTASLFGAALGADEIQIWTDVDGVLSADPRLVKGTIPIGEMTYEEAMEMSHFGAKVIYPPTMQPARELNIPIVIKNTFNPEYPGTRIRATSTANGPVKGISCIKDVTLLRVSGPGMIGITGIAGRMFQALARANINITMITQGSSEHSICAVIDPLECERAVSAMKEEFALQMLQRHIDDVSVVEDLSVIAVTGEHMRHVPGIGGKIFGALGKSGVNVVAIAQGSSERNISIVVKQDQVALGIQAIHDAFFKEVSGASVYLVGTGLIGSTLLRQLHELQREDIRVCGLMNSRFMLVNSGIDLGDWNNALVQGEAAWLDRFVQWILSDPTHKKLFVDCTASEETGAWYERLLAAGVCVVTANKKLASDSQAFYDRVANSVHANLFRYETNVGAGLPVLSTIRSLIETGDEVLEIQGVLSGTLSYLFNTYDGTTSFADLVREAREKGYTEPDPRDDLSGLDVARKLLILARAVGLKGEREDVCVQNLTPEPCRDLKTPEEFLERLQDHEPEFLERLRVAQASGNRLRYVARVSGGAMSVKLESVDCHHPCFGLSGSDNLVAIRTKRYFDRPLVIQGSGAGAEVTAAGVLHDLLSCLK